MMTSVAAEEELLEKLNKLSTFNGLSVGLIIGQISSSKTYVIHFAPTPEQSKEEALENFKDLDETRLGEHSRYVTRMLPGGLWVLGVFIVNHEEVFTSPNTAALRRILTALDKSLSEGFCLKGKNPSQNYLIFHYNGTTKKYMSKTCDYKLSDGLKNVDWKFQSSAANWCEVNSEFYLNEVVFEPSSVVSFRTQLEALLEQITKNIESSNVYINDKEWDDSKTLETVKKASNQNNLEAKFYQAFPKESSSDMRTGDSSVQLLASGCLPSRVFLHPRATIKNVIHSIREDILRSLAARLEMHWDSLVDEQDESPEERERVHEPPRRVLVKPKSWVILLADFLFPGENSDQVVRTCKELLDLDVELADVIDDFESPADASAMISSFLEGDEQSKEKVNAVLTPVFIAVLAAIFLILALLWGYFLP